MKRDNLTEESMNLKGMDRRKADGNGVVLAAEVALFHAVAVLGGCTGSIQRAPTVIHSFDIAFM